MFDILHVTPHLGGGVGSVLLNYLKGTPHTVAALDYANEKALTSGLNIYSDMHKDTEGLLSLVAKADITVIHFWNHPLLFDFLLNTRLPSSRVVFWSHISGFEPPYVFTQKMLNYPDKFIFTTPLSFSAKEVQDFEHKEKLGAILSTGGVEPLAPAAHDGFNVGYIGTVDYVKMHPKYIEVHKKIDGANFIIVGGDREKEIALEAGEQFEFTGKVGDVRPYLSKMDVFGYLLNEKHYGTAEQALQEAMAAGVVPVVLNNPTETMLVKHNETGLVAKNLDEYIEYIELLRDNAQLRENLSKNAKIYANSAFSLSHLKSEWDKVYKEMMKFPKIPHGEAQNLEPIDVFLESLGSHNEPFMLYLKKGETDLLKETLKLPRWQSETKGTPKQYSAFFGKDEKLKEICKLYE